MIFLAAMLWPRPRHPRVGRVLGCEDFDKDVDEDTNEDVIEDVDEVANENVNENEYMKVEEKGGRKLGVEFQKVFITDILNQLLIDGVVLLCSLNDKRISECFLLTFVSPTLSFHGMECCGEWMQWVSS